MAEKEQILEFIRNNKDQFYIKFRIIRIGIFGSVARNEQTDKSDIDLIVEFEADTPDLFHKKNELKKIFSERFDSEVDICRERYIKPIFKKQIIQDALYA